MGLEVMCFSSQKSLMCFHASLHMHKSLNPIAPTRSRQRNTSRKNSSWSDADDQRLISLVSESAEVNWTRISKYFPTHTQNQIIERWSKVLDPNLLKGSWTRREDELILRFVAVHGAKQWSKLAELLPGRIAKQCRERWINHLNPSINHGPWTPEEDQRLIDLHMRLGNQWAKISELMPARSQNSIKNRWNSTLVKRMPRVSGQRTQLPPIFMFCFEAKLDAEWQRRSEDLKSGLEGPVAHPALFKCFCTASPFASAGRLSC